MYGDDDILFPVDDSNQEEYVPISSFQRHKNQLDQYKDDQYLKKYGIKKEKKERNDLFYYYCTICGRSAIIYDEKLEELPIRKLDATIIIDVKDRHFKHYLENGDICQIVHDNVNDPNNPNVKKFLNKTLWMNCKCGLEIGYFRVNEEILNKPKPEEENIAEEVPEDIVILKPENQLIINPTQKPKGIFHDPNKEPTREWIISKMEDFEQFYL